MFEVGQQGMSGGLSDLQTWCPNLLWFVVGWMRDAL